MSKTNDKKELIYLVTELAQKLGRTPTLYELSKMKKIGERKIRTAFGNYSSLLKEAHLSQPIVSYNKPEFLKQKIKQLKEENELLKADLNDANKTKLGNDKIRTIIGLCNAKEFGESPEWLKPPKKYTKTMGTPNLFISDVHFDEIVNESQIQYVNKYNREIAISRLKIIFQNSIDILKGQFINPSYDGFALHLGGDLLSGIIHEELRETNEDSISRSILLLTDLLIEFIEHLLKNFNNVLVTGVVGNHGRMSVKPHFKNRSFDNYEWFVYQYLMRYFKNNNNISFIIPEGSDAVFQIYNKRFLLTHGDQFQGGTGISGLMAPLMLGLHRKRQRQAQIQKPFDIMMMGHWHQYIHTDSYIVNGSVKGYDEYAFNYNFPFERPQQAMFILHPINGVTWRAPILCGENK